MSDRDTPAPMSYAEHTQMLGARKFILEALKAEMARRGQVDGLAWIDNERMAVANAANQWALAHGVIGRVTVADVQRIEGGAVGHFDYGPKLALYVAEFLYRSKEVDRV